MTARSLSLEVVVECVAASTPEECINKTKAGQADLVTLDGGDVFEAGKLRIFGVNDGFGSEAESRTILCHSLPQNYTIFGNHVTEGFKSSTFLTFQSHQSNGSCVYYRSNIFRNPQDLENWAKSHGHSPVSAGTC